MRRALMWVLLLAPLSAWAQYKCVENGRTVYADRPCSGNAKLLVLPNDAPVSSADRAAARASYYRQKAVADDIDVQNAMDQRDHSQRLAQQATANAEKEQRCADLLRQAQEAKNRQGTYRYHQGLIDNARRENKEAEDAHFSECYGSSRR
jgi:hypothetical protein